MSSISISPSISASQQAPAKPQVASKPPVGAESQAPQRVAGTHIQHAAQAPKPAVPKSPQAGGNGMPSKPVSTSTKTVQDQHRINVRA